MASSVDGIDALEQRQLELLEEIKHPTSPLYLFALLDALVTLFDECTRVEKNSHAQKFVERCSRPFSNALYSRDEFADS